MIPLWCGLLCLRNPSKPKQALQGRKCIFFKQNVILFLIVLILIFQMSLEELTEESKLSISAHIHRDGGIHFGLTDKTTSHSDQLTFTAPQV